MRDDDREMVLGYARAVLMAVREPDGEIVSVGHIKLGVMPPERFEAEQCFTAMIDAILAGDA